MEAQVRGVGVAGALSVSCQFTFPWCGVETTRQAVELSVENAQVQPEVGMVGISSGSKVVGLQYAVD